MAPRGSLRNTSLCTRGNLRGKTIGLLGLAFKPNRDAVREAAPVHVACTLWNAGARSSCNDPVAMDVAARVVPKLELVKDPHDSAEQGFYYRGVGRGCSDQEW